MDLQKDDLAVIEQWLATLADGKMVDKAHVVKTLGEKQWYRLSGLLVGQGSASISEYGDPDRLVSSRNTAIHLHTELYHTLLDRQVLQKIIDRGNRYNAKMARIRYYLFWPTTILGICGGLYALYQLLSTLHQALAG